MSTLPADRQPRRATLPKATVVRRAVAWGLLARAAGEPAIANACFALVEVALDAHIADLRRRPMP